MEVIIKQYIYVYYCFSFGFIHNIYEALKMEFSVEECSQ